MKPTDPLYPAVARYGDFDVESFDAYWSRWPQALGAIPKSVVEDWIYRHWPCFRDRWIPLAPHTWDFELVHFSNDEILAIDHVGSWIADLDAEGVEYVGDTPRARTRLARYMRANGTFPVPIIVAAGASHVVLPRSGGAPMKTPWQLVEGHCRLACLRGMIHARFPTLSSVHAVWLVRIPAPSEASRVEVRADR